MPKSMRVKTRFEASETVTRAYRKMEKGSRRLGDQTSRSFRKMEKSALSYKSVLKGVLAAGVISKGFNFMGRGLREVSTGFIDFENTITEAAVKFTDIGPRAKDFSKKLLQIEKSARKAGEATKFTAPQAAEALLLMAKGGFTSAEAMGALRGQIDFAIASGEEFTLSTRISTKLLGAFGLSVKDTEQKIKNLDLVNDTLATTVNSSTIGIEELFDAMKDIGPVARNLNTDIVDVAAMAGVLGNEGIDATKAMTGMRSMFLNLAAPSTGGAQILRGLGLTLDSGSVKAKNMTEFLFELTKATRRFSEVERTKIFRGIFGKTGIAAATILSQGAKKVEEFRNKIKGSRGEVALMSKIMQTTLKGRIAELNSALTELGFKVLAPFEKQIKSNIKALTEFFRGKDPRPLINSIKKIASEFKTMGQIAADAFKKATLGIEDVSKELKKMPSLGEIQKQMAEKRVFDITTARFGVPNGVLSPGAITGKDVRNVIKAAEASTRIKKELRVDGKTLNEIARSEGLFSALASSLSVISNILRMAGETQGAQFQTPQAAQEIISQFQQQPQINVDVQNNINAEGVTVDTKVKAPGTSGKVGQNNFE